ncbi:MAG TPA: hypothetical protein PK239_11570 [Chitinophagales bacterium]|nr:hypothetical protein [Chitinophagales bacterium]HRK27908.1 hypothetical protein [Chitinophagales bacterium]
MQTTVIGNFNIIPDALPAEGNISIVIQPIDIITHWRRCGLLADFIAGFYNNAAQQPDNINLISTVMNELLENATKYSRKRDALVALTLKQYDNVLKMQLQNYTTPNHFYYFKNYLASLLEQDNLEQLYIEKIVQKSDQKVTESGMGMLILLKDYPVKIGATFIEDPHTDHYEIITQLYYYFDN